MASILEWSLAPIIMGFIAGATVFLGTLPFPIIARRAGLRGVGLLQALSGGVLAYLALEVGAAVSEYVESLASPATLREFLIASLSTTVALLGTWYMLSASENWGGIDALVRSSLLKAISIDSAARPAAYKALSMAGRTSVIVALGLGIHNVGEGFAIAAALLGGAVASAVLFTIGFAIHNFTEGFAIAGPLTGEAGKIHKMPLGFLAITAAIAALPTMAGASIYYIAPPSDMLVALLNTIAEASLVYALIRVNLSALGKLGGPSSPLFWTALGLGVALTYGIESMVLLALAT
ncbi:MAG: ZIP family metal transporter [Desulfurococcales archaeon]|nr:ZIP family metal transporter [Desulfurococcales archaeon]